MAQSDIVTIHTPNTPATRGLISRELIGLMKPSALLVNCARGPIVDSAALADALNEGRIAGLQVYSDTLDTGLPELLQGLLVGAKFGSAPMAEALRYSDNEQVRDIAAWLREENL